jgi:hypothetical protein
LKDEDNRMAHGDYLEFELAIGHGDGHTVPLAVLSSPAGQAQETMRVPFSDRDLEDLHGALASPSAGQEESCRAFGRKLFDALFTGQVRLLYDESLHLAAQRGEALRLKLRIDPSELADLPWELLYDPRSSEHLYLSPGILAARHVHPPQSVDLPAITPPLRILGMVASPGDLPPVSVDREKQRLEAALSPLQARDLVQLTWLEGQAWHDLQQAIWSGHWHAFHFVGPGGLDGNTGEGFVVLTGDDGQSQRLSTRHLGWLLASHESLRLVWLSTSEGGRGRGRDRFASTATTLMQRGIPGVITMQYPISEQAAVAFVQTFYGGLVATMPVDLAVTRAREAVRSEVPGTGEWGVPALHASIPELRYFDRETLVTTATDRGGEALAADDFERAIEQYAFAIEMGGGAAAQENIDLAEDVGAKLKSARDALDMLAGSAEAQAVAVLQVLEVLDEIRQRLPGSQAIQHELSRAQEKASGLRDRLWERGQRLMRRGSVGLTPNRRRKRLQAGVRLLENAARLDTEDAPALKEDLAKAVRRLSYLESAQDRTEPDPDKRQRPVLWRYGLVAAALVCAVFVALVVADVVPISSLIARATATMIPTATSTAVPALTAEATPTTVPSLSPGTAPSAAAAVTSAPTASFTTSPTSPDTATPSHTEAATEAPQPIDTPTPIPPAPSPSPQPTAVQTQTATPTAQPGATPTAAPKPAEPTPPPTLTPTPSAPAGPVYPAPVLLEPEDIAYFSQDAFGTYLLRWNWDGNLQAGEWFDVRVWQEGMPHYGLAWTRLREYTYDICLQGSGHYYWSVAIVRGEQGIWQADLSPEATPRRFTSFRHDAWCERHGRQLLPPRPAPYREIS